MLILQPCRAYLKSETLRQNLAFVDSMQIGGRCIGGRVVIPTKIDSQRHRMIVWAVSHIRRGAWRIERVVSIRLDYLHGRPERDSSFVCRIRWYGE